MPKLPLVFLLVQPLTGWDPGVKGMKTQAHTDLSLGETLLSEVCNAFILVGWKGLEASYEANTSNLVGVWFFACFLSSFFGIVNDIDEMMTIPLILFKMTDHCTYHKPRVSNFQSLFVDTSTPHQLICPNYSDLTRRHNRITT